MKLIETTLLPLSAIEPNRGQIDGLPKNPRALRDGKFDALKKSISDNPEMLALRELLVYQHGEKYVIIGGNMRYRALKDLKYKDAPCKVIPADTPVDTLRAYVIKDNGDFGEWDFDLLANEWDDDPLEDWGVDLPNFSDGGGTDMGENNSQSQSLNETFIVPPISVFDTRKGYWQTRKKMWRSVIGDMGSSRNDTLIKSLQLKYKDLYVKTSEHRKELGISFKEYLEKYVSDEEKAKYESSVYAQGVSLFDPVISEIICKWFTPCEGATIFDCFAGDTQKGIVFAECGYTFKGIELRQEQVDINNRIIAGRGLPISYVCDDGINVAKHFAPKSQDLLFSCPPYFDLEVYSDLPNDASNQGSYEDFIGILRNAFTAALGCLKNDRFAVIVVGDVRNKKTGCYYDLCGDIKRIFRDSGAYLYNEIIIIENIGSKGMSMKNNMKTRKTLKCHQNILVFYKGNPKNIKSNFPEITYSNEYLQQFQEEYNAE